MKKDNIVIVLVEPQSPGNIGSTARAMKNMGFRYLRLVDPPPWRDSAEYLQEAEKMAWGATDQLAKAENYVGLAAALHDVQWVVGTSARNARYRVAENLSVAADMLEKKAETNRVALLFGSESRGLSTEELSLCQQLVTIPTSEEYPTLNLAQSVLLFCYQLTLSEEKPVEKEPSWASQETLEAFYEHAQRVLLDIGYLNRQNPKHGLEVFRKIFGRAGLTEGEVKTIRGVLRQIDWSAHRWTPPLW
ncbi:RNA methyltransferase [candidate division CSSED10-310 bacterium]|uniref:tRNA (cytidine/uridine-2'-O-)-methyltransferase TrmJ n=1 Tax=candidate division CSSED10-310 bacterium TaxID=2855610 RepID=A0ABV6YV98_UNCC1